MYIVIWSESNASKYIVSQLNSVDSVQDPVKEAVHPGVDPGNALGAAEPGAEADHADEVGLVKGGNLKCNNQSECPIFFPE